LAYLLVGLLVGSLARLSWADLRAASYLVELGAYLQEVVPASFQVEVVPVSSVEAVVPCAWLVAGVVHRLSLEVEGAEAGSRPWQSSYGKAGDAMKESGR
jgi:hypothetical protein